MTPAIISEWFELATKLLGAATSLATFFILIHQFVIGRRQQMIALVQQNLVSEMDGVRTALVASEKKVSHAEGVAVGAEQQSKVDQARADGIASNVRGP